MNVFYFQKKIGFLILWKVMTLLFLCFLSNVANKSITNTGCAFNIATTELPIYLRLPSGPLLPNQMYTRYQLYAKTLLWNVNLKFVVKACIRQKIGIFLRKRGTISSKRLGTACATFVVLPKGSVSNEFSGCVRTSKRGMFSLMVSRGV